MSLAFRTRGDRLKRPMKTFTKYHMYHTYTCLIGTDVVALLQVTWHGGVGAEKTNNKGHIINIPVKIIFLQYKGN